MQSSSYLPQQTPEKTLSLETLELKDYTRRRHPTVYDAVAGRISTSGFISKSNYFSHNKDTTGSSCTVQSPENVLFRSKKAPTRFADNDIYFANERNDVSGLPNSDLLKALHTYTTDFYFKTTNTQGALDWKSLDGTALIALGILTEELVKDILGETGDLALTEGIKSVVVQENQTKTKSSPHLRPLGKKRKINPSDK